MWGRFLKHVGRAPAILFRALARFPKFQEFRVFRKPDCVPHSEKTPLRRPQRAQPTLYSDPAPANGQELCRWASAAQQDVGENHRTGHARKLASARRWLNSSKKRPAILVAGGRRGLVGSGTHFTRLRGPRWRRWAPRCQQRAAHARSATVCGGLGGAIN